jgi:hypothetical protein
MADASPAADPTAPSIGRHTFIDALRGFARWK